MPASTTPVLADLVPSHYGSISQAREDVELKISIFQQQRMGFQAVLQMNIEPEMFPNGAKLLTQHIYGKEQTNHLCYNSRESLAFDLGKAWIQSCTEHVQCQKAQPLQDQTFRPTRLIEITSSVTARLVETKLQETSAYVALSHCWGKLDPKTKFVALDSHDKVNAWKSIIPVEELAKNFRDAIQITFGLGLKYLWIDSLCIIQYDKADWEIESAKMGYVYANAICTISATGSNNAHGGCFFPGERFKSPCTLGVDSNSSLVALSEAWSPRELFKEKVERAPVTTRAWTFQERILSRRVLHFSKGTLLFECGTMIATEHHKQGLRHDTPMVEKEIAPIRLLDEILRYENFAMALTANSIKRLFRLNLSAIIPIPFVYLMNVCIEMSSILRASEDNNEVYLASTYKREGGFLMFPMHYPKRDGVDRMREAFQAVLSHPRRNWNVEETLEFHQQWFALVDHYSARDLTNHTDRLVAIIGVATFIQEHTGTQFLAGLWRASLAWDLLWICDVPNQAKLRSDILPTWSWASIDGRIRHDLTTDVASAQQTASNEKRLEDIMFYVVPGSWDVHIIKQQSGMIHNATLVVDRCLLIRLETRDEFVPDLKFDRHAQTLFMMPIVGVYHDRYKQRERTNIHGIPVPYLAKEQDRKLYGIVLRELATKRGTFERVGYFSAPESPILDRARRYYDEDSDYVWRYAVRIE